MVTLTFVIVGIFLPADLIRGGIRYINTRYMIPCYLGMQIAVSYFFAVKMTSPQVTMQLQKTVERWLWLLCSLLELYPAASICQQTLGGIKTALILTSRSPAQPTQVLSH